MTCLGFFCNTITLYHEVQTFYMFEWLQKYACRAGAIIGGMFYG